MAGLFGKGLHVDRMCCVSFKVFFDQSYLGIARRGDRVLVDGIDFVRFLYSWSFNFHFSTFYTPSTAAWLTADLYALILGQICMVVVRH